MPTIHVFFFPCMEAAVALLALSLPPSHTTKVVGATTVGDNRLMQPYLDQTQRLSHRRMMCRVRVGHFLLEAQFFSVFCASGHK
jgi:hypothetical protein